MLLLATEIHVGSLASFVVEDAHGIQRAWVESPVPKTCVLVSFSIAVKRYHYGDSYEGKCLIRAGLQFRGLVHYHHDRKHGRSKIVAQQI